MRIIRQIRNISGATLTLEKSSTGIPGIVFQGNTGQSAIEGGNDYFTAFVGGSRRLTILSNGNIGIGTITPSAPLFVDGQAGSLGLVRLGGGFDYQSATVLSLAPGTISFDAPGLSGGRFTILGSNGNVGIGTANPTEKLSVNGTIRTKEIRVENAVWPDYVFKADYDLRSLEDVKHYIQTYQHLPEMPAALDVAKNGANLGEINALLLKKIEELTLYLIEKDNQLRKQNEKLDQQQKQINEILSTIKK